MKKLFLDENLYSISFPKIKVIDIPSIHLRKIKNNFQTDTDLSRRASSNIKKPLVEFKVDNEESLFFGDLTDNTTKWDQFEINKLKFNVQTSYEETHYTTVLDEKAISEEVKIMAEKIVKEIESEPLPNNVHLKEERGLIEQTDNNEEERYSSVFR